MISRLALLLLALLLPARAKVETFYLGTYTNGTNSQGIYAGTLDTDTGKLGPIQLAAAIAPDPTVLTLSPDHRFLFAALGDAVASFAIAPDNSLRAIDRQPSCGPNTCFVSLDKTGRQLFATSYDAGSIAAFPVDAEGKIGPATAVVRLTGSGPNKGRQQSSHPHSAYVDPENRHLYVPDLGADRIWIFRLGEHGTLVAGDPSAVIASPGIGPRHLLFSPDGSLVYVVNELGVSTCVYARDPKTGALTLLQTHPNILSGWPPGTGSAEVALHASGNHLYVSTRLQDFITVFRVMRSLRSPLELEQVAPSPVKFPRSFAIDPSGRWLVVAGETDNRIGVMKIDPATGRLTPTAQTKSLDRPVCVLFAP
ncbi:MAG TPA: lactonase family protein [Candidatus Methylacidiphilales bacterium]|jgi:6-phosphogluconolactonase|nr:lactonase family protein [Candidatus Methylacidiphilales bacterium]